MRIINYYIFLFVSFNELFIENVVGNNSTLKGTLDGNWEIELTIFSSNFQGLVMYGFDYKNRLLVLFKGQRLILAFNLYSTENELKYICNCSSCLNSFVNLKIIKGKNVKVNTKCRSIIKEMELDEENKFVNLDLYPLAKKTANNNTIFINMGRLDNNIEHGKERYQFKEFSEGCLSKFYYNQEEKFLSWTNKYFTNKCNQCLPNICNDGLCYQSLDNTIITCNCKNSVFNGHHCDRDLQEYKYSDHIYPFYVSSEVNDSDIKFSWKHESTERLCLLELSNEKGSVIIVSDKNKLMIDNEIFENLQITKNYFFWIKFTKNNTSLSNNKNRTYINVFGDVKINIGFSENEKCSNFNGKYDLDYNKSKIVLSSETVSARKKKLLAKSQKYQTVTSLMITFMATIGFLTTIFYLTINIIVKLRKKKTPLNLVYRRVSEHERLNLQDNNLIYDLLDYDLIKEMDYMDPRNIKSSNMFENNSFDLPPPLPPRP